MRIQADSTDMSTNVHLYFGLNFTFSD